MGYPKDDMLAGLEGSEEAQPVKEAPPVTTEAPVTMPRSAEDEPHQSTESKGA